MEECEVDLREYIRILWRAKWVVVGVVVIAIGLAAVLTVRSPDVYRAEVLLTVERPAGAPKTYTPPTADWVVERVLDPTLLDRAAQGTTFTGQWLAESLGGKRQGSFVQLFIQGPVSPQELKGRLGRVVAALEEETRAEVKESITLRLTELQFEREAMLAELAEWEDELGHLRRAAEAARDRLRSAIAEIRGIPGGLKLGVGADATVQGYLVQKELDLLYARLQAVELALDEMERLGPTYVLDAGRRVVALKTELTALDTEEASLRAALSALPDPLVLVRGPTSSGPLGAGLRMNLGVAGVLGLFVGVLLAFFVHWLRAGPAEPEQCERPGPSESGSGRPDSG